jgi:hypothetical protein
LFFNSLYFDLTKQGLGFKTSSPLFALCHLQFLHCLNADVAVILQLLTLLQTSICFKGALAWHLAFIVILPCF